jgi:hypothetical protein
MSAREDGRERERERERERIHETLKAPKQTDQCLKLEI